MSRTSDFLSSLQALVFNFVISPTVWGHSLPQFTVATVNVQQNKMRFRPNTIKRNELDFSKAVAEARRMGFKFFLWNSRTSPRRRWQSTSLEQGKTMSEIYWFHLVSDCRCLPGSLWLSYTALVCSFLVYLSASASAWAWAWACLLQIVKQTIESFSLMKIPEK